MVLLNYDKLSKEDFDAIVTGELTHYAIWLQHAIVDIITNYFVRDHTRHADFRRLLMLRDGLTFQDQLEITRAMIPLLDPKASEIGLGAILKRIEDFKSYRNGFAHGVAVSDKAPGNHLRVEIVNRAGREKTIEVTPESHRRMLNEADTVLKEIQKARDALAAV